ncbi:hypothetical protein NPIL_161571 [Nephila pilipes]|uniref:Uncharacterized protein n=1 Tax=Nephila pilipes TaxID=299642 RepID=A0A8X6MCP8_NEPPI|nr:hypothetical protein NPIL_161571 [Nephila pilipes]
MESAPEPNMTNPKSPPDCLPIEEIVQALEKSATHDGIRQIIFYIEANLSETLANPHQTEETKERTMNLSDLLIEARKRSLQINQKEIERLQQTMNQDANQWGLSHEVETPFTIVKTKSKSRKPTETQAAKEARTDDDSYKNRFSHLTIQEINELTEMETATITPMPSPPTSPRRTQRPSKEAPPPVNRWRLRAAASAPRVELPKTQELSTEDFPPLPTQPKPSKPIQEETTATDPFTILKHPKCRELYREMQEFVNIAQNIPTKAGRMAALFKFIEED